MWVQKLVFVVNLVLSHYNERKSMLESIHEPTMKNITGHCVNKEHVGMNCKKKGGYFE